MAWTREFDTTYQTHYWYDAATGASSWTEPPGWSEPSVEAENPETDRLTNKDDELELVDLGPRRRERSQDDSDDESDEDVEMLPSSRADAAARQVYAETAPTMRQWRCCFYFHANFCEQYCAAAEALIRAPCYVVAGVLIICCRPTLGYRYIREGLLFAALGITLLLPCAVACGVYGDHSVDKDTWLMKPVCTLLGCVDARRLFCITCGQGSLAKNATFGASETSQDSWPGRVVHPPLKYWRKGARACSRAEKMAIAAFWVAYHYAVQAGHALLHYGREGLGWARDYFRDDGGRWRRVPSNAFPAAFSPERPPRHDPGLEGVVELV